MSDDLQIIKDRLVDDYKLEELYEAMNCEFISFSGGRIEAQLPEKYNSTNRRAVQTKLNKSLSSSIRTPVGFKGGDIFALVSFLVFDKRTDEEFVKNLYNAKRFICETLGWTEYLKGGEFRTKKDYVAPLKAILKTERKKREIGVNPVLPDEVMNEYYFYGKPLPYSEWIEEGISYKTQVLYGVGFDLESKRVVFPLKNRFGQIVGVKGRIMKDEDDPERKYLYLHKCNNRYEWFNFHIALQYILMEKRVYIVESEKSAMKLFENKVYNVLAIGASEISWEQVEIIKQLGMDIEIVLCYDKGINVSEITTIAERFNGVNPIFSMYDTDNLLIGKNAPIDQGIETWNKLVKDYIFAINIKEK